MEMFEQKKGRWKYLIVALVLLLTLPQTAQGLKGWDYPCGGVSEKVMFHCVQIMCWPDPSCGPTCWSEFREEIKTHYHEQTMEISAQYTVGNVEEDLDEVWESTSLLDSTDTEPEVKLEVTRYKEGDVISSKGYVNYTLKGDAPDTFRGMSLTIDQSRAAYYKYITPVQHRLTKTKSSSGPFLLTSRYGDYYDRQDMLYGFPDQCKEICPAPPRCTCPENPITGGRDIMSPLCLKEDASTMSYESGTKDNLCSYFYPSMPTDECVNQKLPTKNAVRDLCNRFTSEIGLSECRTKHNEADCYEKFTDGPYSSLEQTLYEQCHGDLYFEQRDDCVCNPPEGNMQCTSNRNYHEEEIGGRIVNGGFEMAGTESGRDEFGPWEPNGDPDIVWMGRNGHALHLQPGDYVVQRIPEGATKHPAVQSICLEYGTYSENSGGEIVVKIDGEDEETKKEEGCDATGWYSFCVSVPTQPETINISAKGEDIYVDNVNIGAYQDFAYMRLFDQEEREDSYTAVPQSLGGLNRLMTTDYQDGKADGRKYHTLHFSSRLRAERNPLSGAEGYETLSKEELENANITILTYFDQYSVDPDVNIRDAVELSYEVSPDSAGVYPGQRMTVNVDLSNVDAGSPASSERVYAWLAEGNISNLNPSSDLTWDSSEEKHYVTTDGEGKAQFKFDANNDVSLRLAHLGSSDTGPSKTKSVRITVLTIDTTILSPNILLILVLIVVAVFSYRFLKGERTRLEKWWEDFKGEK